MRNQKTASGDLARNGAFDTVIAVSVERCTRQYCSTREKTMMRILLLCCALLVGAEGHAHDCEKPDRCQAIKEKIRNIESRMRHGYSAAEGIRLDERLRKLREQRGKACR